MPVAGLRRSDRRGGPTVQGRRGFVVLVRLEGSESERDFLAAACLKYVEGVAGRGCSEWCGVLLDWVMGLFLRGQHLQFLGKVFMWRGILGCEN